MEIRVSAVQARYLGDQRAEVTATERSFVVDQRANTGQEGAKFCPIELVAASLAS
ncbi:MAG: hypothetical protein GXY76_20200 [Chloroflexi bacterium]|nr:hypothetical protein [Chloroflexota bacterium]